MTTESRPRRSDQVQAFSLATDTVVAIGGTIFNKAMLYIINWLLARHLGAAGLGVYALIMYGTRLVSTVAKCGFDVAAVRYVSFYRGANDVVPLRAFLRYAQRVVVAGGVIWAAALLVLPRFLVSWIGMPAEVPYFPLLVGAMVLALTLYGFWAACLHGFGRVTWRIILEQVTEPVVLIAALLLLLPSGLSLSDALFAACLSYGSLAVITVVLFSKALQAENTQSAMPSRLLGEASSSRQWLLFSVPALLQGTLMWLMVATPEFFVNHFLGAQAVGVYEVALKLSVLVLIPRIAINVPLYSAAAQLYGSKDIPRLSGLLQTATHWSFLMAFSIFFVILTLREPLLLLFGAEFVHGEAVLLALLCGELVNSSTGPSQNMLLVIGRVNLDLFNTLGALGINLLLNFWLVPVYGLTGAAIAYVVTVVVNNILRIIEVFYLEGVWPYTNAFLWPILVGLATLVVVMFMRPYLLQLPLLLSLAIMGIAIVPLYMIVGGLWGMDEKERTLLYQLSERYTGVKIRFLGLGPDN